VPAIVSCPKYKIKQDCPYRCAILAFLHLENTSRRWQSTLWKKHWKFIGNPAKKIEILTRNPTRNPNSVNMQPRSFARSITPHPLKTSRNDLRSLSILVKNDHFIAGFWSASFVNTSSYFVKNFQRRHDQMIRSTVEVAHEWKWKWREIEEVSWGRGGFFLGKNMSEGGVGVGSGNIVNILWGSTLIRIFKYFFLLFASFILIN